MDDSCTITRPGPRLLNETTGRVSDTPTTIYGATSTGDGGRSLADAQSLGGKCYVSAPNSSTVPSTTLEGGVQILGDGYVLSIPVDAPEVKEGDEVRITSSRRDPRLTNQTYRVRRVVEKSFVVSRKMVLEAR